MCLPNYKGNNTSIDIKNKDCISRGTKEKQKEREKRPTQDIRKKMGSKLPNNIILYLITDNDTEGRRNPACLGGCCVGCV